jgi:hypothetical protein
MHDPTQDLIGYYFVTLSAGISSWRFVGSDRILGCNYVELRRVHEDGSIDSSLRGMKVQPVGAIRRRRQLEQEVRAWADDTVAAA